MKTQALMNLEGFETALQEALNKPTLTEALASMVLWEHLRICADMRAGIPATSYFAEIIQMITNMYIWESKTGGNRALTGTSPLSLPKPE